MAKTLKKMGRHGDVSYCVTITKCDDGVYEPRLVILFAEPVIFECDEIFKAYSVDNFKVNPYSMMVNFCIGFIDSGLIKETK